jgi:aerobic-type carbon monoxide dehydrogenase small subunit (CoxS/CutS family)
MKPDQKESPKIIAFTVNGIPHELEIGDKPRQIAPSHTLAHTLRETLNLTGTKVGCDQGACGSCTVLMDGVPILSCMTLTVECGGRDIITIEGLQDQRTGELAPLQQAFIDHTAFQCGFCTPGILMASKSLLEQNQKGRMIFMSNGYRFIGKPTPRKDAQDIVTGRAKYIDDLKQPEMLCGKVLRSPHPHANIKNIDTKKAEALPGVRAVLTHKDVPDWRTGMPKHARVLTQKVRFVGDAVALVAAETEDIACAALDLIRVEYEKLPAVYDMEEAMEPDAPQLYPEFPGNIVPRFPAFGPNTMNELLKGDTEEGFKAADFISEGTARYENIANPLPIEPPGVIARWESDNQLTVW